MGRKKVPGLVKRGGVWHVDKHIGGRRVCESTGAAQPRGSGAISRKTDGNNASGTGLWGQAVSNIRGGRGKFVLENQHKRSLDDDILQLKLLMPWIGREPIDRLHLGTLKPWIEHRQREGKAMGTINHGLKIVRRILNLAASEWVDEQGLTWLPASPKIKLLPDQHKRPPYPLNWEEQERLFGELPDYLAQMALFAVNTGCRDQEICSLRWDWEVSVPQLGTSVFIIPGALVKNGDERLIVLNRIAKSVVEVRRGPTQRMSSPYKGKPIRRMMTSAWKRARLRAGLPQVRVHDLKHTFGRRLRAAGVSFEDRQDLLGHRSGRITTHYSAAELSRLIAAANSVCERELRDAELVVLRGSIQLGHAKLTQALVRAVARNCQVPEAVGGCRRTRTFDPLIKSQLLYQLSYTPAPQRQKGPARALDARSSNIAACGVSSGAAAPRAAESPHDGRPRPSRADQQVLALGQLLEHRRAARITQCMGVSGTTKRAPVTLRQRHVEPVEQRAAAGQHDAALDHLGGDLRRQVLERALDELGHLADAARPAPRAMSLRPEHRALHAALAQVAALDVDLHLAPVRLRAARCRPRS